MKLKLVATNGLEGQKLLSQKPLRAHEVVDHVLGVDDLRAYLLLEEDEDVRVL